MNKLLLITLLFISSVAVAQKDTTKVDTTLIKPEQIYVPDSVKMWRIYTLGDFKAAIGTLDQSALPHNLVNFLIEFLTFQAQTSINDYRIQQAAILNAKKKQNKSK